MFDMDEAGRKAVKDCAGLLKGLKVANLPLKDPNECLMANKGQSVINAIWNAKAYKPDGIVNGADLWVDGRQRRRRNVLYIPLGYSAK